VFSKNNLRALSSHLNAGHVAPWVLSSAALVVVTAAFLLVLSSYIYSFTQPVRWPTLIYFYTSFVLTLLSKRWAIFCIIASFPLVPDLHIQLQYIKAPAVKYFVAHPGIDLIAGYVCANFLEKISMSRPLKLAMPKIPWPLSLALIVITVSAGVSIVRSLFHTNTRFSLVDLINQSLQYKLMGRFNDYYPVADVIVHAFAVLFIVALLPMLKDSKERDELIFKPICVGLIISALWGLYQALTSFGLPITTSQYRVESFGFGAHGFQPDLHAFAAHMLLGAVGLYGYIVTTERSRLYKIGLSFICILCWLALVLSKSRASLIFAILYTFVLLAVFVVKDRKTISLRAWLLICLSFASILIFTFFQTSHWLKELYYAVFQSSDRSFDYLNQVSKFRLEFYTAALRMWSEFPLFGLGQGSFFKLSAIQDFSGSPLMVSSKGENAHNYFLQALAEVGLIGFVCYAMVFIWPLIKKADKKYSMWPAGIAVVSIFLGNLYSHSLLIRENLYLLAALTALLYAQRSSEENDKLINPASLGLFFKTTIFVVIIICGAQEVLLSFHKVPFSP
jgi:hypothetical protein